MDLIYPQISGLLASCDPGVCDNDTVCETGEDCNNCSFDCPTTSLASCGNNVCEPGAGEDCVSCPGDCNGRQSGNPNRRYCCGDGVAGEGEQREGGDHLVVGRGVAVVAIRSWRPRRPLPVDRAGGVGDCRRHLRRRPMW